MKKWHKLVLGIGLVGSFVIGGIRGTRTGNLIYEGQIEGKQVQYVENLPSGFLGLGNKSQMTINNGEYEIELTDSYLARQGRINLENPDKEDVSSLERAVIDGEEYDFPSQGAIYYGNDPTADQSHRYNVLAESNLLYREIRKAIIEKLVTNRDSSYQKIESQIRDMK